MSGELIPEPKTVDAEVCPETWRRESPNSRLWFKHDPKEKHVDLTEEEIHDIIIWMLSK